MLVTMQNAELINKLMTVAEGDIELVQNAIRAAAAASQKGEADLQAVVQYIIANRKKRPFRDSEERRAAAG